jgi:hypothetical protein
MRSQLPGGEVASSVLAWLWSSLRNEQQLTTGTVRNGLITSPQTRKLGPDSGHFQ